jgi:monofunctional glycosyltransferase
MATAEASTAARPRRRRRLLGRVLRPVAWLLATVIAIPLFLTPLYGVVDPISVPMLQRHLAGEPVVRIWRPLDGTSDRLKAAVMLSEDGQFCRHRGVDLGALRDEIQKYLAGRHFRGASTITMQVARNLFLVNSPSLVRKVLEVPLAFYLDLVLSKRRIMEIYLNVAEWGPNGEFGIEAGAQAAFGVSAEALTWERASLLAVALPNPLVRNPARPGSGLRRVAQIIEQRARQFGAHASCLARSGGLSLQ